MKTNSQLACVAPCFYILDHDHRLNCAATSLSTTLLGHYKTQEKRPKELIKFDQQENCEKDTSLDFR